MKNQALDLRGEVCPYTFVRTKLALEELDEGDELTLRLDHRPAFESVPRALREDGHEILAVQPDPRGSECVVIARKRGALPSPA